MTKTPEQQLATAIRIMGSVHENHLDKGGKPYALHPIRIAMRLRTDDMELMAIAMLHDVIEDSEMTIEDLRAEGFSQRVLDALALLTHDPEDSYETYIRKMAANIDAILVKLEDLRDNSDITRLKGLKDKDFKRMQRYQKAFTYLRGVLENYKMVYEEKDSDS